MQCSCPFVSTNAHNFRKRYLISPTTNGDQLSVRDIHFKLPLEFFTVQHFTRMSSPLTPIKSRGTGRQQAILNNKYTLPFTSQSNFQQKFICWENIIPIRKSVSQYWLSAAAFSPLLFFFNKETVNFLPAVNKFLIAHDKDQIISLGQIFSNMQRY